MQVNKLGRVGRDRSVRSDADDLIIITGENHEKRRRTLNRRVRSGPDNGAKNRMRRERESGGGAAGTYVR